MDEKGTRQAELIKEHFHQRFQSMDPKELDFQTSPKKRCVETLEGLAKSLKKEAFITPLLDERQSGEDSKAFTKRIRSFLESFKQQKAEIVMACSHGDYIPSFIKLTTDLSTDIGKAGWIELSYENDQWRVEELVAHWKDIKKL